MLHITRSTAPRRVVGSLHVLFALLGPLVYAAAEGVDSVEVTCVGLALGQVVLLAAWVALATSPRRKRLPAALGWATVLFTAALLTSSLDWQIITWKVVVVLVATGFVLRLLLGAGRIYFGWTIGEESEPQPDREVRQFSIRGVMIWTAGLAVLLALGRLLAGFTNLYESETLRDLTLAVIILSVGSLPGVLCIGAVCDAARPTRWFLAAFTTAVLCMLGAAVLESGGSTEMLLLTGIFEIALCGNVVVTLGILTLGRGATVHRPRRRTLVKPLRQNAVAAPSIEKKAL